MIASLNILQLYILIVGVILNIIWIRVAMKENGGFSKRETVQLLLINMAVAMLASELGADDFDVAKWGMALGTLVISEGLKVYEVVKTNLINGNNSQGEADISG